MPPASSHFADSPVPAPPPTIGSPRSIMPRNFSRIWLRAILGMLVPRSSTQIPSLRAGTRGRGTDLRLRSTDVLTDAPVHEQTVLRRPSQVNAGPLSGRPHPRRLDGSLESFSRQPNARVDRAKPRPHTSFC